MSQETVEIVRRGFDAFNAGDVIALREVYDPDVVWHHLEGWPEPGPSVGREAVLREVEHPREAWQEGDSLEPVRDFVKAGNQVLAKYLFTFRKGRIITIQMFSDHAEALEAVRLSE